MAFRPEFKAEADSDDPAAPAVNLKPCRSWRRQHEHGRWEPVQAEAEATSPKNAASEPCALSLAGGEGCLPRRSSCSQGSGLCLTGHRLLRPRTGRAGTQQVPDFSAKKLALQLTSKVAARGRPGQPPSLTARGAARTSQELIARANCAGTAAKRRRMPTHSTGASSTSAASEKKWKRPGFKIFVLDVVAAS